MQCLKCGARGPIAEGYDYGDAEKRATEAWNSAPRKALLNAVELAQFPTCLHCGSELARLFSLSSSLRYVLCSCPGARGVSSA